MAIFCNILNGRREIALAIALLSSVTIASAQSIDRLAEADSNGDGSIDRQELMDMRAEMFSRLDRNGDGFADAGDSPRMGPPKRRFDSALSRLQDADSNGDGRISEQELLDAPTPAFDKGDADGDGLLSGEELAALRESET